MALKRFCVLLGAVLVVACSAAPQSTLTATASPTATTSASSTPAATPGSEGPSDSAYGRLFAQVGEDGSVSLDMALQAFSLAIAPLPGVEILQGSEPVRDYERADGTFAVSWIRAHFEELTADQKAGVDEALAMPDQPAGRVAMVGGPEPIYVADEEQPYLDALNAAEESIAAHLGRNLSSGWAFDLDDEPDAVDLNALAFAVQPLLPLQRCGIHAVPLLRGNPDPLVLTSSMAHEMFHCFQFDIVGLREIPDWIIEGQAEWVGEEIGGTSGTGAGWFREYIEYPRISLFRRTYDAVGFYEHVHEVGRVEVWGIADAMLRADGNEAAFVAADAASDEFLDTWPSGFFRDQALGDAWFAQARWGSPYKGDPVEVPISVGRSAPVVVEDPSQLLLKVVSAAEIIQIHIQGHARMQESGHQDRIGLQQVDLCTSPTGCECKNGWTYRGPPLDPSSGTFNLAVTGGLIGAAGSIEGHALDEFCFPDHLPSGGRCSQCARDTGDPHMTTVDLVHYEFQAAGEFVALRSADGSIEIQGRQQPSPVSSYVTINTAVAMLIGGHRLSFDSGPPDNELIIRLDGQQVSVDVARDLGAGANLLPETNDWRVAFPDGTIAYLRADHAYGVTLMVQPSDSMKTSASGLLGPIGDGARLPRLPDGSVLPVADGEHDQYVQRYQTFADAWRVTDATSLFDYAPGKSTADYQRFGYPTEEDLTAVERLRAERYAAALAACAAVIDPDLRRECMYDVSVTGDAGFADEYVTLAEVGDTPEPTPTATPMATPASTVYPPGFIEVAHDVAGINSATQAPDGTLYVFIDGGLNGYRVAAVDPSDGTILRSATTTRGYGGRIAFANGWLWLGDAVEVEGSGCSLSRFDPETLQALETIPTVCPFFNTAIAGTDDGVWYYDEESGGGAVVRLLADTATQEVRHVALPSTGGRLLSSHSTLFHASSAGTYRLLPGATSFELMASSQSPDFPLGAGFWTDSDGIAAYYEAGATPTRTVAIQGELLGADDQAVYATGSAATDTPSDLWRYPFDGSQPAQIADAATMAVGGEGWALGYGPFDNGGHPLLIGPDGAAKLWTLFSPLDRYWNPLVMQFTALPPP